MKYIILQVGETELPFIFPELVQHKDIASIFKHPIISAGFFEHNERGALSCFGESVGLNIKSRPKDIELIRLELEPYMLYFEKYPQTKRAL